MTVSASSRDAEGDAQGTAQIHQREVAGGWFSSPAPVGASAKTFGSSFWALASESEGSDGEIWEEEGAAVADAGDRSAWSPPPSRVLGDFLGLEQGDLVPVGRSVCHRSPSRSRSPEIRRDPFFCSADFPPLSGAKVGARVGGSTELLAFKLQVGAWSFEVPVFPSLPVVPGASSSASPDLEGLLAIEERGDVDTRCPHSSERGRDPSASEPISSGAVEGSRPILSQPAPKAQLAKPVNGPARLKLLFSPILKWVWRPVGTLDPTFSFSASTPDLQRACLPPFHTRILLLPPSATTPLMDCGHRDDGDSWEGHQNLKRPYDEKIPLEERKVDSLSESELCLLLECQIDSNHRRGQQGDRSPPRIGDSGHFEGEAGRFAPGPAYPRARGGGKPRNARWSPARRSPIR
jgi:hypothetical protein